LGIDTLLSDAIFDATEARTGVVTLLACLLAVCASVLDLPALGAKGLCGNQAGWERIHVHGHARIAIDGMNGHLRLKVCRLRLSEVVAVWRLIALHRRHAAEGEKRRDCMWRP
jgi:hypothetical protein